VVQGIFAGGDILWRRMAIHVASRRPWVVGTLGAESRPPSDHDYSSMLYLDPAISQPLNIRRAFFLASETQPLDERVEQDVACLISREHNRSVMFSDAIMKIAAALCRAYVVTIYEKQNRLP
jgi:hypothetical protein